MTDFTPQYPALDDTPRSQLRFSIECVAVKNGA